MGLGLGLGSGLGLGLGLGSGLMCRPAPRSEMATLVGEVGGVDHFRQTWAAGDSEGETGAVLTMSAAVRARAGWAGLGLGLARGRRGTGVRGYGGVEGCGLAHRVPLREHHGVLDARGVLEPGGVERVDMAGGAQRLSAHVVYSDEVRRRIVIANL